MIDLGDSQREGTLTRKEPAGEPEPLEAGRALGEL